MTGIVLFQLTINRWHLVKIACNNSGYVCDINTVLGKQLNYIKNERRDSGSFAGMAMPRLTF